MSSHLEEALSRIIVFQQKINRDNCYDPIETSGKEYRLLNWKTLVFSKTILLIIQKRVPEYNSKLNSTESNFLEDLEYSENRLAYEDDLNLLINDTPKEILDLLITIIKKLI